MRKDARAIGKTQLLLFFCIFGWQLSLWAQNQNTMNLKAITKQATINGLDFPYYDLGEGDVVLLLHGFPDSKFLWRNQLEPLKEAGYRVIVPDLRGFGDAPKPDGVEAYALTNVLNDLIVLLDGLQIKKVHVIGHDWGGTTAWLFAGLYPERTLSVTGLTVGAPGAPGRRQLLQLEKLWYVFFFQNEDVAEEWLSRDDWQGLSNWTRENGDFDVYRVELSKPGALTAGLNWYRANFKPSSLNSKSNPPRIKVPAMGIAAENDDYLLEDHVKLSHHMVDGPWTYHLVKNASHWLMLDKPEEVNSLIIDFLNSVD